MSEKKGEIKPRRTKLPSAAEGPGRPSNSERRRTEGPKGRRAEGPKGRRAEEPNRTPARSDWWAGHSEETVSDWQDSREPVSLRSGPRVKRPRCQEAAGKSGLSEGRVFSALGQRGVPPDKRRRVAVGRLGSSSAGFWLALVEGSQRDSFLGRGAFGGGGRQLRGRSLFAARAWRGRVAC